MPRILPSKLLPGKPYPMGAHWDGLGINFCVFSAHAERVELCLFDAAGRREISRMDLPDCTDEVFHGYLEGGRPGQVYGFRVHGPYQPEAGHRFNPHKLLLDPYAKKTIGALHWSDALFGYRVGNPRDDLSFDRRDSAAAMPKAVVVDGTFHWGNDIPPNRAWADTVIYETHVRGMTLRHPEIAEHERGSFSALGDPYIIDHLVKLGVTAVELLPIHAYLQDRFLFAKSLRNYWGYSTLSFFAPEPSYLSATDGSLNEIRMAVRRLHSAGIEVILDVVYNHTCEGSEMGPTLSWRGFDNLSYYQPVQDNPRHLVNDTGCGNTINITHPRVLQMVMDSLRHWAQAYHVDGFRFDLGTTLGREPHGFDPCSGFFDAIRQDPVLSRLKLISEPWDIGPGGYQLGNHPPGFGEWNDRYRDGVRRYWRGDSGQRPELAARLLGSSDIFEKLRRKTWASVNFVTSHDGFTLQDTVSYDKRHNEANGEDGKDGHGENFSRNFGVEGPSTDPAIVKLRERVKRAMLTTLLTSHGTPMLLGGDELGRTQNGNNNAYCQDNEISWFDWSGLTADNETPAKALVRFLSKLLTLRRQHPSLRSETFLHGTVEILPGMFDVGWFDEQGETLTQGAWADGAAQLLALRRAVASGDTVDITLLLLNATAEDREFRIPPAPLLKTLAWEIKLDSTHPEQKPLQATPKVMVGAHGAVLLAATVKR
jgi:glycogen operon protein